MAFLKINYKIVRKKKCFWYSQPWLNRTFAQLKQKAAVHTTADGKY